MLLLTPRSDHPDDIARATYKALPFSKLWKKKKPYTAVTVQIERLTSEQFEPDDYSGIVDLIEVVRLQSTGPTEAARAVRKKLYVYTYIHLFTLNIGSLNPQKVRQRTPTAPWINNPRWTNPKRWIPISTHLCR